MLWPVLLPFKVTLCLLAGAAVIATIAAPRLEWSRTKAFLLTSLIGCFAFIPACVGVMLVVDSQRFGTFHYDNFSEVQDFRVERYLPTQARDIALEKLAGGHRAKYAISESELRSYVDQLWQTTGGDSAVARDELDDGVTVTYDRFAYEFKGLGWPLAKSAIQFHSPVESDGGGATYYFDPGSETAYHRAGYW